MKSDIKHLNILVFCYAFFSFTLYIPEKPMNVYDWLYLILFYSVAYLLFIQFIIHGNKQKPLSGLLILIYILYLVAKQIMLLYKYVKLFHGQYSATAVIIISIIMLYIFVYTDCNLYKLAFPCLAAILIILLLSVVINAGKISALNLYRTEVQGIRTSCKTLFDYIIPYGITMNSITNDGKRKAIKTVIISNSVFMLTVIFVFSCFNGNLLYSLSPLQAVFQLSSTKLIRNFDAIFDYMLFFSYFASAAVLMMAYKVTKKEFTYFNNADLLLVIPLFFMVLCTENMLFIIESALAAVVFLGMDRKGKT